jgi:hypothetical protein
MAFVDLAKNQLVLKVVVAGSPAVGKTTRLQQIAAPGALTCFGSNTAGKANMASLELEAVATVRKVVVEAYEWHGHERADVRAKALFTGLDGVIYIADAREDRYVDTKKTYEYLMKEAGRTRLIRLPGLLLIGQKDEGLLRLASFKSIFAHGPTWSQKLDIDLEPGESFVESVRLFAEVMLSRTV